MTEVLPATFEVQRSQLQCRATSKGNPTFSGGFWAEELLQSRISRGGTSSYTAIWRRRWVNHTARAAVVARECATNPVARLNSLAIASSRENRRDLAGTAGGGTQTKSQSAWG